MVQMVTEDALSVPAARRYTVVGPIFCLVFLCLLIRQPVACRAETDDSNTGYIDNANIGTPIRFRFDAAYGADAPDRAEFFYGKCGCFRSLSPGDPHAPGPAALETNVDFQDIRMDLEVALNLRWSVFAELPVRLLNPQVNENTAGLADLRVGFKYAFWLTPDSVMTFQLRNYIPTGDALSGLGTDHFSIEPGLLHFHRFSDRLTFESELRPWIPIGGSSVAGVTTNNPLPPDPGDHFGGVVLRYGVGLGYDVLRLEETGFRVTPVVEIVGWQLLGGYETLALSGLGLGLGAGPNAKESEGISIVNLKGGLRFSFGNGNSLSVSYGTALTDDIWYDEIVRFEFRRAF